MKKHPFLVLIAGLAILILTQQKIIMPLVYEVIKSDLFLVESKDTASPLPISTPLTALAFMHCNNHIKSLLGPDTSITFPDKPLNAWSLGNYQYVINAEIGITSNTSKTVKKKYACRINYKNGDDQNGVDDVNNWSIVGLSGLDNL